MPTDKDRDRIIALVDRTWTKLTADEKSELKAMAQAAEDREKDPPGDGLLLPILGRIDNLQYAL